MAGIWMHSRALERENVEDGEAHARQPAGGAAEPVAAAPAAEAPAADADWSLDLAANWRGTEGEDEGERSFVAPDTPTLRDHLNAQLSVTNLGLRDRVFVELLIDALDDDGYLTQSLEEIAALLPPEASADAESLAEELSIALRHLQHFEPAGVGARSPGECLCLQLRNLPDEPVRTPALDILDKHLALLATHDYSRLKTLNRAGPETLPAA